MFINIQCVWYEPTNEQKIYVLSWNICDGEKIFLKLNMIYNRDVFFLYKFIVVQKVVLGLDLSSASYGRNKVHTWRNKYRFLFMFFLLGFFKNSYAHSRILHKKMICLNLYRSFFLSFYDITTVFRFPGWTCRVNHPLHATNYL